MSGTSAPGVACSDDSEGPKKEGESDPVTLTLSDPNATEETKALYSNLWAIQSKGFMFGHHDDLMYGRTWYGTEGGSDTKAVCGDYPAVYSFDFAEHIDDRHASDPDAQALRLRCCREAYDRGMVLTSCIHINNPLTGGDSWDNSSNRVAAEILTEDDIPLEIRKTLGFTTKQRLNTLIHNVIMNSMNQDDIRMSADIQEAMFELRHFMFDHVYTNPIAKGEEVKAKAMIRQLFGFYKDHIEFLPEKYLAMLDEGEKTERVICDYIAGMTDQYAITKFSEYFLPQAWQVDGY